MVGRGWMVSCVVVVVVALFGGLKDVNCLTRASVSGRFVGVVDCGVRIRKRRLTLLLL